MIVEGHLHLGQLQSHGLTVLGDLKEKGREGGREEKKCQLVDLREQWGEGGREDSLTLA
jgi:hypothetical protein